MQQNDTDAVISEVRAARHGISERFGHDPERLVAYYIDLQERYRDRMIGSPRVKLQAGQPGEGNARTEVFRPSR